MGGRPFCGGHHPKLPLFLRLPVFRFYVTITPVAWSVITAIMGSTQFFELEVKQRKKLNKQNNINCRRRLKELDGKTSWAERT